MAGIRIGRLVIERADGKPMTVRGEERREIMRRGGIGRAAKGGKGKKGK